MNKPMIKPVFDGEVLLCEDNRMNQEIICERLSKMGLTIITAQNGKEGVEQVKYRIHNGKKLFALIFMDIYMPVMGGLEAAEEIGRLNTGIPIIAMTANSSRAEREQYAVHGMSECLNKPFTSRELLDCLLKYLPPVCKTAPFNLHDDENIKIKLMYSFVKNNKDIYSKITRAVDDGDIILAHRLAHTLKGNAGLLEKNRLLKAAEDVESRLSNAENRLNPPVMNALKTELDAVLAEFAPLIAENITDKTETGIAVDHEQIQSLFAELETLLDSGDIKCLNLINNLRVIPEATKPLVNEPLVRELIRQIEYFEFGKAMKTLIRLKEGGYYGAQCTGA